MWGRLLIDRVFTWDRHFLLSVFLESNIVSLYECDVIKIPQHRGISLSNRGYSIGVLCCMYT
jgi:hypothetical protein